MSNHQIGRAQAEYTIPGMARRCDVLIEGLIRKYQQPSRGRPREVGPWATRSEVAVEINVTNPKDSAYIREVTTAGQLSVVELPLTEKDVERSIETFNLSIAWSGAVKRLIMGTPSNRKWLFRRGQPS